MSSMASLKRFAVVIAGAAIMLVLTSVSAAREIPQPDYTGKIRPHGQVAFRILRSDGRPTQARFEARGFEVRCEDGSTQRLDFNIRKATFTSPSVFEGYTDGPFGGGDYYRFHGRLLSNGRARGFIFVYVNPLGATRPSKEPECSTTGGTQRWVASERKDRR